MLKDILGDIVRKLVEIPKKMLGAIYDLLEKLCGGDSEIWFAEFKKFLRKEKCWLGVVIEPFLKLISGGEELIVDEIGDEEAREVLADAKELFEAGIDSDFRNYGADEPGLATKATKAEVYEVCKDGKFTELFGSLSPDVGKFCWTQSQIKKFIKNYHQWLRTDGYATLFLFKSHNNFFVAVVRVSSDSRLFVRVRRFEYPRVWNAEHRYRLVVPQLA